MGTFTITKSYHEHARSDKNILLYDRNSFKYSKIVYELFLEAHRLLHLPMDELIPLLKEAERKSTAKSRCFMYTSRNRVECSTKGGFPQWYVMTLEDYNKLV